MLTPTYLKKKKSFFLFVCRCVSEWIFFFPNLKFAISTLSTRKTTTTKKILIFFPPPEFTSRCAKKEKKKKLLLYPSGKRHLFKMRVPRMGGASKNHPSHCLGW